MTRPDGPRPSASWAGVSGLAVALGPSPAAGYWEHFWWGSIFLVKAPTVIVALVAGQILLPASRDPRAGRFDLPGLGLSVATLTTLVYTVIEGPHHGRTSPMTLGGLRAGRAPAGRFHRLGTAPRRPDAGRADLPQRPVQRRRRGDLHRVLRAVRVHLPITQYFQFVRGYSTLSAGLHTLPFAVVAGAVAVLSPWLAQRLGSTRVVAAGLAFMAAGFVVAATLSASSGYWGPVIASMVA
ncbi:hypothetical protein [Actinomadura sp. KC216]|uniref:hypothetical protein n=1 Tax=Actinomadura sp. KC216 TaxID=2530370 RepID=UPI001FB79601|nr:hypothetical protein [Actinomadura sp. KC216]